MSNSAYTLLREDSEAGLKYFFISKGKTDIIKAIEYSFVVNLNGRSIFNLAFGDYIINENLIDDLSNSDNGDARKVLFTVLNTVPQFFETFPLDIVMVAGSDSKEEYLEQCLLTCRKDCNTTNDCRNKDKRISVYKKFVSYHFKELSKEYAFFGGVKNNGSIQIVPYTANNTFDTLFVIKKV